MTTLREVSGGRVLALEAPGAGDDYPSLPADQKALAATVIVGEDGLPATGRLVGKDGDLVAGSRDSAGVILTADIRNFSAVLVQVGQAGVGCTLEYEQNLYTDAEDDTHWFSVAGKASVSALPASTSTTPDLRVFPRYGDYFRIRCSTYGSGLIDAVARPVNKFATPTIVAGIQGQASHDVALNAGIQPVMIGGWGTNTPPADASAAGDMVRAWFLLNGMLGVFNNGQVTTSPPTYSDGEERALSLTPSGRLRVDVGQINGTTVSQNAGPVGNGTQRVVLASDDPLVVAVGAKTDAAWDGVAASASLISIMKAVWAKLP